MTDNPVVATLPGAGRHAHFKGGSEPLAGWLVRADGGTTPLVVDMGGVVDATTLPGFVGIGLLSRSGWWDVLPEGGWPDPEDENDEVRYAERWLTLYLETVDDPQGFTRAHLHGVLADVPGGPVPGWAVDMAIPQLERDGVIGRDKTRIWLADA